MNITSNKTERTYTIRKNGSKFKTSRMTKEEWNECQHNTIKDWENFLKCGSYTKIK
jgi:hypothetical protein